MQASEGAPSAVDRSNSLTQFNALNYALLFVGVVSACNLLCFPVGNGSSPNQEATMRHCIRAWCAYVSPQRGKGASAIHPEIIG